MKKFILVRWEFLKCIIKKFILGLWEFLKCIYWGGVNFWQCFLPSIAVLILLSPVHSIVLRKYHNILPLELLEYPFLILPELLLSVVLWMLLPRVVVTVTEVVVKDKKELILWADGRKIYKRMNNLDRPFQFTFQVWRKSEYELCLDLNDLEKPGRIGSANTYDQRVCHVTFDNKEKNNV